MWIAVWRLIIKSKEVSIEILYVLLELEIQWMLDLLILSLTRSQVEKSQVSLEKDFFAWAILIGIKS